MGKKAIFWDFDGTLAKANCSFLTSLLEAFRDQEVFLQEVKARRFLKDACSWYHPEKTYEGRTGEAWWQELLGKLRAFCRAESVPEEKIPGIAQCFRDYALSYPYELYPDARKILGLARSRGCQNYILSNNFPELDRVLTRLGLSEFLDGCFLSSRMGWEKPHPELFAAALEAAGNPETALMVGDNPEADMKGGKAAGMTTVLVHSLAPCPQADHRISSLSELENLL